jgi:thioredoxin reductase
VHISGCFDNENGAPVPGGFAAGDAVSNRAVSSAMRKGDKVANSCLGSHLK